MRAITYTRLLLEVKPTMLTLYILLSAGDSGHLSCHLGYTCHLLVREYRKDREEMALTPRILEPALKLNFGADEAPTVVVENGIWRNSAAPRKCSKLTPVV